MLRIYLLFLIGSLPLCAQSDIDQSGKLYPDAPPTVNPATPAAPAVIEPGVNPPPPGTPVNPIVLPAAPVIHPKLADLIAYPGTIRQGLNYKDTLRTTVTLTAPALKEFICHMESSDPVKVVFGNIRFIKGQLQGNGGIQINWKNIHHDGQVELKAFDDDNPEIVLHARIYLRKKAE